MKTLSVLIAILIPSLACAQEYPSPSCTKPDVALIAPQYNRTNNGFDSGPVGAYNSRVKQYNGQATQFNACIRSYLDKATADGKQVQDEANAEIARVRDAANLRLKSINEKAAMAAKDASDVAGAEAMAHPQTTGRPDPRALGRR